jgi:hypothetical protein
MDVVRRCRGHGGRLWRRCGTPCSSRFTLPQSFKPYTCTCSGRSIGLIIFKRKKDWKIKENRRVFHVFLKNAAAQRRDQRRRAAAQIAPRSGAWRRAAPQEAGERSRVIKERFSRVACSRIFRHLVTLSVSRFSHIRTHTDTRTDKGYICRPLPRAHRQNRVAETHKARKIPARSARSACT